MIGYLSFINAEVDEAHGLDDEERNCSSFPAFNAC
jgi:hypothetical protein